MNLIERIFAAASTGGRSDVDASALGSLFSLKTDSGLDTVEGMVGYVLGWLLWIAGILAFAYLVYAGILYITANGNDEQAKKGQKGIINAIIGIIIIVLAYTIIRVAMNLAN